MLLDILIHKPEMLGVIVRNTPTWVWGLLAGLMVLGATQLRDRTVGVLRVALMPVAMTAFSIYGNVSAFGKSPHLAITFETWLAIAVVVGSLVAMTRSGATYDAAQRQFHVPGSVVPLLLIATVFLVKWSVGVELAMQPSLILDNGFALAIAALYGVFNGLFIGRAARLALLAYRPAQPVAA